jgi:hypothetical protein
MPINPTSAAGATDAHPAAADSRPSAADAHSAAAVSEAQLPHIRLGPHSISRLICGANTFNAGSHMSVFLNAEMRAYFTPQQVLRTLRHCQAVGINCWQAVMSNLEIYRRFVDEGGTMHFISLDDASSDSVDALAAAGCIAIAHHGETTDQLFKAGKLGDVRDYLKKVRDAGLQVGVSTHIPDVVDAIESAGWDIDFFMTCVYERHRSAEQLQKLLGHVPLPVGEVYLADDPPRMYRAIRQTPKPCLAFKILAAGRLSDRPQTVEAAFAQALASIKPTDAVIVGIYDRYSDQPAENAALVRRFAPAGRGMNSNPLPTSSHGFTVR